MAAVWVRVAGIAAVLLGLKAGFLHDDIDAERLWAAAGIAIAATAGATMAVWRRREGWAFCAALGANVAASLVVWHVEETAQSSFRRMVAAARAGQCDCLVAGRPWFGWRPIAGCISFAIGACGKVRYWHCRSRCRSWPMPRFWSFPVGSLLMDPQGLPVWMHDFADPAGWLSLLLPAAAAAWYLERTVPGKLIHVLGGLGLGAGVLVACQADTFGSRRRQRVDGISLAVMSPGRPRPSSSWRLPSPPIRCDCRLGEIRSFRANFPPTRPNLGFRHSACLPPR